ncbi:hypothetical protein A0H81_04845 [Grifola frondosa]|uniref:Uncharacterized protein n=1 Tax=Grifola frondosa TaxID=5627 RepID=A0A1C7MF80_GRIFR|nr:hypothetical protein A0H81_04845 [Grifola frondosa]
MVAPKKRAAEEETSGPTTRGAKAPKTERATSPKTRKGKKGPKTNMAASAFKARALPLHINITHTPPALGDDGTVTLASTDPGFIGTTTLLPSTFATGSYGWKGNKRLTIELQNSEGEEKEKVHVMLTINATVMGSKGAKEEEEEAGKEEGKEEHEQQEHAEEGEEHAAEGKAEHGSDEEAAAAAEHKNGD